MIEYVIIGFLLLLLGAQQAFFMWQTQKLLNKLMSKNYAEYVQVQQQQIAPVENGFRVPIHDDSEFDDLKVLNDQIRPF